MVVHSIIIYFHLQWWSRTILIIFIPEQRTKEDKEQEQKKNFYQVYAVPRFD